MDSRRLNTAVFALLASFTGTVVAPTIGAAQASVDDPRAGLAAGWNDAEEVASGVSLVGHQDRPPGFFVPDDPGFQALKNSDLAFSGTRAFQGNYNGFLIYDIADPASPELLASVVCPGSQGDLSVYGDLLFRSDQDSRGRIDCGTSTPEQTEMEVNPERFRGVRIFDVSNPRDPVQVAAVQTCRGSHTHTVVSDPDDDENIYIYVSGTSGVRPAEELEGCVDVRSPDEPETSYWRISVIQVPLDAPENARVVSQPRVFEDPVTGSIDGLWEGGDHGPGTQSSGGTNTCHDITAFPAIGLAAGACQGNGVLFDISDPANPVRTAAVIDPNFAYWHSATFNNDGTKVVFTDEWGGGTRPRCRAEDPLTWGANAIFDVVGDELVFAGYYKMSAAQTETENCVAHNGSLIPVPDRDIMVQAWYQGGISVFDFTDSSAPYEIAYFDRGPMSETDLMAGGFWSSYWYNGNIYGSEELRGFDVLELLPSEHLSENEIAAARLVEYEEFNPQEQPRVRWPAAFVVVRALMDQAARGESLEGARLAEISGQLDAAEALGDAGARRAALAEIATRLWSVAGDIEEGVEAGDAEKARAIAGAVLDLAAAQS